MIHCDHPAICRGTVRCADDNVANISAGQLEALGKYQEIDITGAWNVPGKERLPYLLTLGLIRKRKVNGEVQPACERFVQIRSQIGRQNLYTVVRLHPL